VRVPLLLFVLALIFFGRPASLQAALGAAPRCFPSTALKGLTEVADANPLVLELRQAIPDIDSEGRDYMIRTIAFEASGEPEKGMAAVAHVILNRQKTGRWGTTIKDVVTHPWQFEPWMTKRKQMENLSPSDPRYRAAARVADAVLAGKTPDPTAGATHFLNPTIVRNRRGGSLPAWAHGEGQEIGQHTFYTPDEGGPADEDTSVSVLAESDLLRPSWSGEARPMLAKAEVLAPEGTAGGCARTPLTAGVGSPALSVGDVVMLDAAK
jgi:hypothetical protein